MEAVTAVQDLDLIDHALQAVGAGVISIERGGLDDETLPASPLIGVRLLDNLRITDITPAGRELSTVRL